MDNQAPGPRRSHGGRNRRGNGPAPGPGATALPYHSQPWQQGGPVWYSQPPGNAHNSMNSHSFVWGPVMYYPMVGGPCPAYHPGSNHAHPYPMGVVVYPWMPYANPDGQVSGRVQPQQRRLTAPAAATAPASAVTCTMRQVSVSVSGVSASSSSETAAASASDGDSQADSDAGRAGPSCGASSSSSSQGGCGDADADDSICCCPTSPLRDELDLASASACLASCSSATDATTPSVVAPGWCSLTAAVIQNIVLKLAGCGVKHLRLVCRHWRAVVDHDLESLTPSELHTRSLVRRFPNLKALHLTNCANIRNRDLHVIACSGLALHTLTLGDDTNKPWVTNEGLACVANIATLTSLSLHDCNGVTNNGLVPLTKLGRLASLSLQRCGKLTSAALVPFHNHGALTSLQLRGCKLTGRGLAPLLSLRLSSLHLGDVRLRDEGLAYVACMTSLQELAVDQEELSDAGVAQLTSLTRLESLALRECREVSGDALGALVPALPHLRSLDLYKNVSVSDAQLSNCLDFLSAVTFLDLRGTPVTEGSVQQLTRLSALQKLCLAPAQEYLWSPFLGVVSSLTRLTSLSINNCTPVTFDQLDSLQQLKLLRELDLSHDSVSKDDVLVVRCQQPINSTAIHSMACITTLTSIDLSRRPVHQEHLSTLAERLPRLHSLIIVGCPVLSSEVALLQRRFPDLIIHRKPLCDTSCSSSDHGYG